MTIADLLIILKERLSKFTCNIANEDLVAHNTSYLRYDSANLNWLTFPVPSVRSIVSGVETPIAQSAYAVTAASGYITFTVARTATEVIRADYWMSPFTDAELTSVLTSSLNQIRMVTFHRINETDFSVDYSEAIIKRAYTVALREIQFPTTKYFALSVAGRSIDKGTQVTQIEALITSNEAELMKDINALRYFNRVDILL